MTDNEQQVDVDGLEVDEELLPGALEDGTEVDPHEHPPEPMGDEEDDQ